MDRVPSFEETRNARPSSVRDVEAFLKAKVQEFIEDEQRNLRRLLQIGGGSMAPSIEISKGTLRVLYAFLQGDTPKCRAAIDAVRNTFTEALDAVMDSNGGFVMSLDPSTPEWTSRDYFGVNQPSENARQLAANLKTKMENFELLYEQMESARRHIFR